MLSLRTRISPRFLCPLPHSSPLRPSMFSPENLISPFITAPHWLSPKLLTPHKLSSPLPPPPPPSARPSVLCFVLSPFLPMLGHTETCAPPLTTPLSFYPPSLSRLSQLSPPSSSFPTFPSRICASTAECPTPPQTTWPSKPPQPVHPSTSPSASSDLSPPHPNGTSSSTIPK